MTRYYITSEPLSTSHHIFVYQHSQQHHHHRSHHRHLYQTSNTNYHTTTHEPVRVTVAIVHHITSITRHLGHLQRSSIVHSPITIHHRPSPSHHHHVTIAITTVVHHRHHHHHGLRSSLRSTHQAIRHLLMVIVHQETLPVGIDFPRLARKIRIIDNMGNTLINPSHFTAPHHHHHHDNTNNTDTNNNNHDNNHDDEPNELLMKHILVTLSSLLGEDQSLIENNFFEYVVQGDKGDVPQQLSKFLAVVLGESSKTNLLLKACNQGAISPAVFNLKRSIGSKIPYKDIRGEWWINIKFLDEEVVVTHTKREQSWDATPQEKFEFTWELNMIFDRQSHYLKEAKLAIVEVIFGEAILEPKKKEVKDVMKRFLAPGLHI